MSKIKKTKAFLIVFCCLFLLGNSVYAAAPLLDSCDSPGAKQEKFTASGCDTLTSTRTCCDNKSWSEWDADCPEGTECSADTCLSSSGTCLPKPELTRKCVDNYEHAADGIQTRTVTCSEGSGWNVTDWKGACKCEEGYKWENGACVKAKYYLYWEKADGLGPCDGCGNPEQCGVQKCMPEPPNSGISTCYPTASSAGGYDGRCIGYKGCYVAYCRLETSVGDNKDQGVLLDTPAGRE